MSADSVSVDVVQASARYRVFGHVVDGDGVLLGCGVLVTFISDADKSRGIDIGEEVFGLCRLKLFYVGIFYFLVKLYSIEKVTCRR
ncbi:hypothetical protein BG842_04965 [Haladaptatus sp. W1]|nr:hypothetical protein BG842_04965 [Haladaptatus sp. W1]